MSGLVKQIGARSGIVGSTTDSTQLEYEEGTFDVALLPSLHNCPFFYGKRNWDFVLIHIYL